LSGIETIIESYPKVSGANQYISDESNKVMQKAIAFMRGFGDEFVSIEHLLMGMILGKDRTSQFLKQEGITEKDVKAAINELRKGNKVTSQTAEETYNALNKYSKNLNELAREGKLDPVIGRDEEIRRLLQSFQGERRTILF